MPKALIIDSSTLFSLERASLLNMLNKIKYEIIIPLAVKEEIEQGNNPDLWRILTIKTLKGKTLKKARSLERLNIGRGEAECCALAMQFNLKFIICDDQKFIRQKYFSDNKDVRSINIMGFAFLLHLFYKNNLINDVWKYFDQIISLNNWQRSEVQVANYTILKGLGY